MFAESTTDAPQQRKAEVPPAGETELEVAGMSCSNCARRVTEAIQTVPGVASAVVSLEGQQASVRWTKGAQPNAAAVIKAIADAGYDAKATEPHPHQHGQPRLAAWELNLWIGVLGTLALMAGEWIFGLAMSRGFQWLSFAIAGAVQVVAGARFYRGAWSQLRVGQANMDALVALGSTTAFGYSAWALLSGVGGHVYFMEAAAIISLISLGHWLEARVGSRASDALRQLLDLAPALARRQTADGGSNQVPVASLESGDLVVLRPGDRVPTDGEVIEGDSALDESMLTGESSPVDKRPGSRLFAGTVNLSGRLVMRVTATGEQTALAHIIAAIQRAQSSRAAIQRLGDRVSSVFVPMVVAVAVLAGLWWGLAPESAHRAHEWLAVWLWPAHPPASPLAAAFIIAAGVLIVACPCAMGLATPAAIMAASNAAAKRGILIRDGVALEKAGQVTTVLFDKTGTLTAGKPSVVDLWEAGQVRNPKSEGPGKAEDSKSEDSKSKALRPESSEVLQLAAGLARHSNHPISQAVASLSTAASEFIDWEEIRGAGVQAHLARHQSTNPSLHYTNSPTLPSPTLARLGALRWLEESGVDLSPGKDFVEHWAAQGATIVGLAIGSSLSGFFALSDTLKPGAPRAIQRLRRQGFKTCLVTGDHSRTAASIAKEAGIESGQVFAEVRPEEKAELVKRLQQQGQRVAFVGDGINDAPALEQADLGIAVSRASDIAREAADIILLKSEIETVPESLELARATLRTIKQNLFWAFFYNAVGVPLAALGFLSPILCAAAMGLSDMVVIGNALRLLRRRVSG